MRRVARARQRDRKSVTVTVYLDRHAGSPRCVKIKLIEEKSA